MWKVLLVLLVICFIEYCIVAKQPCLGSSNSILEMCTPTYNCSVHSDDVLITRLCGYDRHYKQPLVCCNPAGIFERSFGETHLLDRRTLYSSTTLSNATKVTSKMKLLVDLKKIEDLQQLTNLLVRIKYKVINISRYKRDTETELFTSNPLPESESSVIPNPIPLSANTTDPPLELFTSPPILVEASVIPAVVPLQSQTDKPDTSSIMNLYTSAPLPPRANTNPPVNEKPTTPSQVSEIPVPPTTPPSTTKKTVYPIDSRPIVFEDSLPTTPTKDDQIYFPDKFSINELESKFNALSAAIPLNTPRPPLVNILPNRHTCGFQKHLKKSKRLDEASVSVLNEFPWVALLRYSDNNNKDAGFRCSGTLISDKYVLTAAHCLTMDPLCVDTVRLGEWKVSSTNDCLFQRGRTECADRVMDVKVKKKLIHKEFDTNTRVNNIAILRLQMRVPFTDFVRPICLPIKNLNEPKLGTTFTTSGWGTTPFGFQLDLKSKISFPVIHKDYCKEYQYFKEEVCIGYYKRHDFGKMDPGGPVMSLDIADKPQWYLEGILVRGYGCNLLSYPGAYVRVTHYIGWIIEAVINDSKT